MSKSKFCYYCSQQKRGRQINNPWSCLSYKTTLLVTSKSLAVTEKLGPSLHHKAVMIVSFCWVPWTVILRLHGWGPGIFVVPWDRGEQPRPDSRPSFPHLSLVLTLSQENWLQKCREEGWVQYLKDAALLWFRMMTVLSLPMSLEPQRGRLSNLYYCNYFHHLSTYSLPDLVVSVSHII